MRVLLDSNVLLAALTAEGTCHDLLKRCIRSHVVLISDPILKEVRKHMGSKFGHPSEDVEDTTAFLYAITVDVEPTELDAPVCRDPDDDIVLATALAGRADCLVTGDKDLLDLTEFQGIRILKPAEFLRLEPGTE